MSVIEVSFRGTKFSLNCNDAERAQLIADSLNESAAGVVSPYQNGITDLRALFLTAMILQDKVLTLEDRLKTLEKNEVASGDHVDMATTLDKISQYIVDLTAFVESSVKTKI